MSEIWKDLIYQNKNYGDRFEISTNSKIRNKLTGNILKLNVGSNGYLGVCVSLGSRDNKIIFRLHKALMETFVPINDITLIVNHIDGNKLNNNLENLEWCTLSENTQHAFNIGLQVAQKGCDNVYSKLTANDINFIRSNYKPRDKEYGSRALGRKFNVDHMQILKVVKQITYTNV